MASEPPLVKICGITTPEDGAACAALGVWGVGLVFAAISPRRVDAAAAAAVAAVLPPSTSRVGVFVAPEPGEVAEIAAACGLTHVQVHGGGDPAALRAATGLAVIEAIAVDGPEALARAEVSAADLVLLDAAVPGLQGGTGRTFDWALLEAHRPSRPFALAGGLTPDNVADAVVRARPQLVDVSSGVESSPGRKDPARLRAFLRGVALGAERAA
jgi:phosphoribosylanthranilate isomerase